MQRLRKVPTMREGKDITLSTNQQRALMGLTNSLISRTQLASALGETYQGQRDLYETLGYKKILTFENFYEYYIRGNISKRLINMPPDTTWGTKPLIVESDDPEKTEFEKRWEEVVKDNKIWMYITRADRISGIGRYGVLFMGFDDGEEDLSKPVVKADNLLYLRPFHEGHAQITSYETDKNNRRYGLPKIYSLKIFDTGTGGSSAERVHHSRVIHLAENLTEGDIFGTPRLEAVYNDLQNLFTVSGGSAEMFWRGALPGYGLIARDDVDAQGMDADSLQDEMDEYIHGLRRYIRAQGVDIEKLDVQVATPEAHAQLYLDLISGASGIPKRMLTGSERGELASSQDEKNWLSQIGGRRVDYAEPQILRPVVDTLITVGVLPPPKAEEYHVIWPSLTNLSPKDMAETAKLIAEALSKYATSPGIELIMPAETYLKKYLNITQDELDSMADLIKDVLKTIEEGTGLEEEGFEEDLDEGDEGAE